MSVTLLDSSNFDGTLKGTKGVAMVKFYAPWCGHCRMFAPIVREAAEIYSEDASFFDVNVDDCRDIATKFEIERIPSVVWYVDGVQKEMASGVLSVDEIKSKIDALKI